MIPLRALGGLTLASLRRRWRAALLVGCFAALALALVGASRSLAGTGTPGSPGLMVPPIGAADAALGWTAEARGPAANQREALAEVLDLLVALAWTGFAIAAFTIFSAQATQQPERSAEIAIHRVVGASLRSVAAVLLLEALVLAALGLGAGLALGDVLRSLAVAWWPGLTNPLHAAGAAPAVALSCLIGAACLMPLLAVRARQRLEPVDRQVSLRIPAVQVGVSIALLLGSAALLNGRPDQRFTPPDAGAVGVRFEVDSGLEDVALRAERYRQLLAAATELPGVSLVSLASEGASIGLGTSDVVTTDCGQCYFGGIFLRWPNFTALAFAVSPDSFRAGGVRLRQGRLLQPADSLGAERVVVVNRNLAARYFQGGNAVGRNLYLGPGWPSTPYRVVGVVEDERSPALGGSRQPREALYLSVLQHAPARSELLLRLAGPGALPAVLGKLAPVLGSQGRITPRGSEARYRAVERSLLRWIGAAIGATAVLVLLFALVGSNFAMRAWVRSVLWELALRRAVGARRWQMAARILRQTLGIALAGGSLGVFLYSTVLIPALSPSVGGLAAVAPALALRLIVAPMALALLVAALPGAIALRRPPGALLH